MMEMILNVALGVAIIVSYIILLLLPIPKEVSGCFVPDDVKAVKQNLPLYWKYASGGYPCYWFSVKALDKWNAYLCRQCNQLPDGTPDFKGINRMKLSMRFYSLLLMDFIWAKRENAHE